MTRTEAIDYLNERYTEQAFRWPLLRRSVSRELYVRRNLPAAMRHECMYGWVWAESKRPEKGLTVTRCGFGCRP